MVATYLTGRKRSTAFPTVLWGSLPGPWTAAHSRHAERTVVQFVEERPPPDDEAQPADPDRRPEDVVCRNAGESFHDLLETRAGLVANVGRRAYQCRFDHDDPMARWRVSHR